MGPVSKKQKIEDKRPKPFTQKGSYDDEVTFDFGEKKLYVSKNFLFVASPVFKAKFRNEFRERKDKRVQMTGKSYEDFNDFLLCIHPRYQKEINKLNVLRIVPLAEKYQVTATETKCKAVMKSMLSNAVETASNAYSSKDKIDSHQLEPLKKCLTVLKSANFVNYTEIIDSAVKSIARFGYCLYGADPSNVVSCHFHPRLHSKIYGNKEMTYGDLYRDCNALFRSFTLELRNKILSERLMTVNDKDFK